jgi:GntR family transcriptional regulator/MocR family aminotransferase
MYPRMRKRPAGEARRTHRQGGTSWATLLAVDAESGLTLQMALRQAVVAAISDGRLRAGQRLPPSRQLARDLGLGRNTVTAAFDALVEAGVLQATARQGLFVAPGQASTRPPGPTPPALDWAARLAVHPSRQRNIAKPADWQRYLYPFVHGQVDPNLFPLPTWRSLSRAALGRAAVNWWAADHATADDPQLLDSICRHVLPRRGLHPRPDEILVTLGAQHGLYMLLSLLAQPRMVIGIEDPGYPDARNIAELFGARVRRLALDAGGVRIGRQLSGVGLLVLTPAHQCPTMVTMPLARRRALLDWAARTDAILVEDDYEADEAWRAELPPPLMALDTAGCVVHLGSFSKVLAPGLRLGFMVGPAPLIAEARALRRLMHRSVPLNNQRAAALFLAEGQYGALLNRLGDALRTRRDVAVRALDRHLPGFVRSPATTGSALWLRCPDGIAGPALLAEARSRGVLLEPGEPFFATPGAGRDFFRLGLSSIPEGRVAGGIAALAAAADLLAP